jgi:hypothetical protein
MVRQHHRKVFRVPDTFFFGATVWVVRVDRVGFRFDTVRSDGTALVIAWPHASAGSLNAAR